MSQVHDHARGHRHEQPRGGPVVVDIGGDVGALIAQMDPDLLGAELFLRPDRDPSTTTHTGIWERSIGSSAAVVAVFPALLAGGYDVLDADGHPSGRVEVVGGQVGEIDLRSG